MSKQSGTPDVTQDAADRARIAKMDLGWGGRLRLRVGAALFTLGALVTPSEITSAFETLEVDTPENDGEEA